MKKFLRFAAVILAAAALLLCSGCESEQAAIPSPTEEFYVNDFAGVMSEEDKNTVFSVGAALESATKQALGDSSGAQVVAVTVDTTSGEDISEYALRLGREWGVGSDEQNNGAVILLAVSDREVYVAVGYGLEGALPDSKTGRLIDNYGIDYFSENEFSKGMLNLYNAIVTEVYSEYGITPPGDISTPKAYGEDVDAVAIGSSWIGIIVFVLIFILFISKRRNFIINPFFFTGGRGGFGGSSGGFGGFSGGGGSFGGGGAGRGF